MDIKYFNRHTGNIEREKVYGDKAVKWFYTSFLGKLLGGIIASSFVSKLYGFLQDLKTSRKKVQPFIENFNIQIDEFEPSEQGNEEHPYPTFNQFFIRRFKSGKRSFVSEKKSMPAFCEARYFGHKEIDESVTIPVKGAYLRGEDLVANEKWSEAFKGGPFLVARLCPVDYHRFHFPDDGKVLDSYRVRGKLHSVNPIALNVKNDIFITNEREVSVLETENFGKLAFIEVGATCVGKIVQTYSRQSFKRGDEKGYFLFGGSTVVVLGEKGKWTPSDEVLEHTAKGIEVYSKLGHEIAKV